MLSLDLLAAFMEIYRAGSLSAAAERLGVSQPAVSGQLARLEAEVGEPLFVRSRRGVIPTPRAAVLATRVGLHVDGLRGALHSSESPARLQGVLRIAGAAEVMSLRVLPALTPLTARGLRVHATLGLAHDLLALLADGRLDLVIASVRPSQTAVVAVPFVDEEFILVGSPALAHTIDPARLAAEPVGALAHLSLVAYSEELPIVRRYWRTEFGRRPPNAATLVVPDLRAVLQTVIAGAGISVLPRYLAESALAAGTLEQLHHPAYPPLNTLYLAVRRGAPAFPALAEARDHLVEQAAEWGGL